MLDFSLALPHCHNRTIDLGAGRWWRRQTGRTQPVVPHRAPSRSQGCPHHLAKAPESPHL